MSANNTPRLGLPYIIASQAQKEVTHNDALNLIDLLVQPVIKGRTNIPTASPAESDAYIVTTTANGAWIGKENQIAWFIGGAWRFIAPFEGMWFWSVADARDYIYHGNAWMAK